MDISYANSKIRKICTDDKVAQKELGRAGAKALRERLDHMLNAENLEALRFAPGGWHELVGDRKKQLACSIGHRKKSATQHLKYIPRSKLGLLAIACSLFCTNSFNSSFVFVFA